MDPNKDPETIMMDSMDALDAPLLQVTHDEEAAAAPSPVAVATTAPNDNNNNNDNVQEAIHTNTATIVVMDQVTRGEKQPSQYRDSAFALLFVGHLLAVGFFGFAWGIPFVREGLPSAGNSNNHDNDNESLAGILGLCFLSAVGAMLIIFFFFGVMIRYAEKLIQGSLCISIGLTLLFAIAFAAEGVVVLAVIYFLMFLLVIWYAVSVWSRIPFATANLVTATTAIKSNMGIIPVAFGLVVALVAWIFVWTLSMTGVYMRTRTCDATTGDCDDGTAGKVAGLFMMLSFYWTSEVLKNVLVVTVSGVVGTWWFAPHEANSFWSPAILDSLSRASTYSFGSVCLGSLVMALIQVLHQLVHEARRSNDRNSVLLCILECIVALIESIAEYFNKFTLIYIGLYGYDYLTAGKKVMELFKNRGWTTIINNNLLLRTLLLVNLAVGALTGCVGVLVCLLIPSWLELFGENDFIVAFIIAFIIGLFMSNVVFGVIASASDTVMVCFAESPNDFQENFPELSQQMLLAWRQIYPEECGF